ncbi:M14 family zinc carboxypeptidase [Microvirga pudoricolor]|uniref:M14 family zinc carboxypeptidase n=1 Tax=Microvirga pudoricolor TaxID=2778729 RepID=UPI0019521812|nr:M14 family zinc carboxypeptidase [Microvirga pudoricolor]MBM6595877.1 hypothetical protein [Microvirga pudoricolor]
MTIILDARIPRTLDTILRSYGTGDWHGAVLQAWLFEDQQARRDAEIHLARAGVRARLHSAYKPLVHAFLEEIPTNGLTRAVIRYPVHPEAKPLRFVSEAYPLVALLDGVDVRFEPGAADMTYYVTAEYANGATARYDIFAPNRLRENHLGETDLTPTGWLKVSEAPNGENTDAATETEHETVFHRVMETLMLHGWPETEPYAETIAIDVAIAGIERPLAYGDEVMSTREALHEDFYFSLLEFFKHKSGRPPEDRDLKPGQIVPDIRSGEGDALVRVTLRPFGHPQDPERPEQNLDTADAAPSLTQLYRELDALPGEDFGCTSCEGRAVRGKYRAGSRPAVLVTAGQHPNEVSAPVGALRAVRRLLDDAETNIAVIPVENPDGYALHGKLCEANPRHMHHAARYTSLGSDVEYNPEIEKVARIKILETSAAKLHVNLHGYPAHEWTRPFTGYLPRGFELWTIPKGFFLVMRHHADWKVQARALVESVTKRLSAVPGLPEFNRRQIEICSLHTGGTPYEIVNDVPCLFTETDQHPVPMTLITEFPDETIYGEPYRFAHTAQMTTVLAAEEALFGLVGKGGAVT